MPKSREEIKKEADRINQDVINKAYIDIDAMMTVSPEAESFLWYYKPEISGKVVAQIKSMYESLGWKVRYGTRETGDERLFLNFS